MKNYIIIYFRVLTFNLFQVIMRMVFKKNIFLKERNEVFVMNEYENYAPTYTPSQAGGVQYGMKWFKFLIYFLLFFGALYTLCQGILLITGYIHYVNDYQEIQEYIGGFGEYLEEYNIGEYYVKMVYEIYGDGLKALDVTAGVLYILVAPFGIYTRFRLAKYKVNGPLCVYIWYGANIVVSVFYYIASLVVIKPDQATEGGGMWLTSLCFALAVVWSNYVYFNKRKSLFVN